VDNMPPYKLPDKKTVATVKSRSTKKGTPNNYNELRFEDLKDKEQVFFHAERDKDERVKHDSREAVGNDRSLVVGQTKDGAPAGDQKERVFRHKHSKVGVNYFEETVKDHHVRTRGDELEKIDGNVDYHIGKNYRGKVDEKMSLTVGNSLEEKTGTKFAHEAGQEIHLKAGMKVIIEAGMQLTIKGPGGFVDISPAGVTIMGTMVNINSGGASGAGSGSSPDSPKDPQPPEPPDVADDGPKFDTLGKSQ